MKWKKWRKIEWYKRDKQNFCSLISSFEHIVKAKKEHKNIDYHHWSTHGFTNEVMVILEEKNAKDGTNIYVNNKSAIALAKYLVYHDPCKYIDTRYHFIRECATRKDVQVKYARSED